MSDWRNALGDKLRDDDEHYDTRDERRAEYEARKAERFRLLRQFWDTEVIPAFQEIKNEIETRSKNPREVVITDNSHATQGRQTVALRVAPLADTRYSGQSTFTATVVVYDNSVDGSLVEVQFYPSGPNGIAKREFRALESDTGKHPVLTRDALTKAVVDAYVSAK